MTGPPMLRDRPNVQGSENLQTISEQAEVNVDLAERFGRSSLSRNQDGLHTVQQSRTGKKQRPLRPALNPKIREYIERESNIGRGENDEAWVRMPETPSSDEVSLEPDAVVSLPPNPIHKPYKSTQKYLKTQYRLVREDAVAPLRDAIDHFRNNKDMKDDHTTSIYEKVHISGCTFTQSGIAFRITFSLARLGKKIKWSASRRLTAGSVLALSPVADSFNQKCLIVTVAARPLELLQRCPPEVDIYFSSADTIEIDPQTEYIMLEAKTGYYEAHRHTLKALQKLNEENFPLSDKITAQIKEAQTPQYLIDNPVRDITPILSSEKVTKAAPINILGAWTPPSASSTLDPTQQVALQQILTRDLAIIQGPPGTGKTHVSVIALQIMVRNRGLDDPPIIVAAQTNHALDQLLEHVEKFDPEYVRLGGRSGSIQIRQRSLYEIKTRERLPRIPGSSLGKARFALHNLEKQLRSILEPFGTVSNSFSVNRLFQLGILSEAQRNLLDSHAKEWLTADPDSVDTMQNWLHDVFIPFRLHYDEETFDWEEAEEDLEFEQLKEFEAEHGVADSEDVEMLHGEWKAISESWTVDRASDTELELAAKLLDNEEDLWVKVPERLRAAMYQVLRQRAKKVMLARFRAVAREYEKMVTEIRIGRWEHDSVYLSRANLVGLTTTGLSKYRPLIASLQPKIILVEEAAEVSEAQVAAACVESLEHLILVGDHLQLRGRCAVRDLEGPDYNLNVSMFERLINMGFPFKTLLKQRRMMPEFRQLLSSLYPRLEDHDSVMKRNLPDWGMDQLRSFFFSHQWFEAKDDFMSTYNEQEAAMVVRFYRYLMNNGVPPNSITILTFYNAHRKRILKLILADPVTRLAYANVRTVDSFQGNESQIVILSLARNNVHGSIGFLEDANRVCVALSRAIAGFYIFGNAEMVSRNRLWNDVVKQLDETKRIGEKLPLHCLKHQKTSFVQCPLDWEDQCPEGGCNTPCDEIMCCGHRCESVCHAYSHETMRCKKSCVKTLACGHACIRKCHEQCFCGLTECNMKVTTLAQVLDTTKSEIGKNQKSAWENFASGSLTDLEKEQIEQRYKSLGQDRRKKAEEKESCDILDQSMSAVTSQTDVSGGRTRFVEHFRMGGALEMSQMNKSLAIDQMQEVQAAPQTVDRPSFTD